MKPIYYILLIFAFFSCKEQAPTRFTEQALQENFTALDGKPTTLKEILNAHKGTTILINIWASWCKDCLETIPEMEALKKAHPEVTYLYLSLDKTEEAWKHGINKYKIEGTHYFMTSGKKGAFADFVNIDWIPRYMVIGKDGTIKVFKAIKPNDKKIIEHLY